MSRVAVATSAGDLVDPDSPLLLAALDECGVDARLAAWDDPSVHWSQFDLIVVRSTWGYAPRRPAVLDWARSVPRVLNPWPVLEYSSDKHYLAELERLGHRIVPTSFCDVGDAPEFPDGDFVVKPSVGAGSMDAARYSPAQHRSAEAHVARLHALGRDAMIQPYVASVDDVGERALIFIDGQFSHAMTKGAMLNVTEVDRTALFRVEQMSRAKAEDDALAIARPILDDPRFEDLLYARVDVVRTPLGWALMELELVEPSLFLGYDDHAAMTLARAIARRVD